jgi:hypothetical protein
MKKIFFLLAFGLLIFTSNALAQPRIIDKKPTNPPASLAPVSFEAKYEGGMFGYSRKEEGTLKFDDANLRLVFFGKDNKEKFSIPYDAIIVLYPQSKSVQSTGGKVVQNVPLPGAGIAGMFMKDKKRYMIVNFDDPDIGTKGTVNFKIENQQLLDSVIQTLGSKAELQQRGEAFYRPAKQKTSDDN